MNLLSIGNSFSMDAQEWLHPLAASAGVDIECYNLYIGGCSLEMHYQNLMQDAADYQLYINAELTGKCSITHALSLKEWDVITLQQASHFSGKYETYQPYLNELAAYVRKQCPQAKIYIQQTWAYEKDSLHPSFPDYDCDQRKMYEALKDAYKKAAEDIDAPLIPVGDVIQMLRDSSLAFDYERGGLSLNRDGFHLSLNYGRYAAALTWLETFFPGSCDKVSFVPRVPLLGNENMEGSITLPENLEHIKAAVKITSIMNARK